MTCPNCSAAVSPADAFCGQCGTGLAPVPNSEIATAQVPLASVDAEAGSRHVAADASGRSYPLLPPYDAQAYPGPREDPEEPLLPTGGPPQPFGIPDYEQPGYARPASYADELYDSDRYRPRAPSPAQKGVIAAAVVLLAIVAVTLAGLALVKHSHTDGARQRSSSSQPATRASGAHSGPRPVRTVTVAGTPSGTSYRVSIWAEDTRTDCAAHAYGKIAAYLSKHRCVTMTRRVGTTTVAGKAVGFALTSITLPSQGEASDFRHLVTADGTGNLNDLLREGKALPSGPRSVPQPDAFSAGQHMATVIVVDSWYLSGRTPANDRPLTELADDFYGHGGVG